MIRNTDGNSQRRYASLLEFCEVNRHLKKGWIAKQIGAPPWRLSKLKNPGKYGVQPTNAEIEGIAALLNQPPLYVRELYPKAA